MALCVCVGVCLNGGTVCIGAAAECEREAGQTECFTHAWAIHSPITAVSFCGLSAASGTVRQSDVGIKGELHRSMPHVRCKESAQIHVVFKEDAADVLAQSSACLFESKIPGFISVL